MESIFGESLRAHEKIQARSRLISILQSNVTINHRLYLEDIVQVYQNIGNENRGKWMSRRAVLSAHNKAKIITVSGNNSRLTWAVAFEYTRVTSLLNRFAKVITVTIGDLDKSVSDSAINLCALSIFWNCFSNSESSGNHADLNTDNDVNNITDKDLICPFIEDRISVTRPEDKK